MEVENEVGALLTGLRPSHVLLFIFYDRDVSKQYG